ncbi:MAG: NAD(P)/FAD-dependent oxidoreductase [Lysobacterales bacterium]
MADWDFEVVVVGAGVVGLACAEALSRAGHEVLVLEREARAGEGISSRNSGVIHAGLYYPQGSNKARWCVRGAQLLYEWCGARGVAHRRCGKLVVASADEQIERLRALLEHGRGNGVRLQPCSAEQALRRAPGIRCAEAIWSPDSGIVDVPELVDSLTGALQQQRGQLLCRTTVQAVQCEQTGFTVTTEAGDRLRCRWLVNAAGLGAIELAQRIDGLAAAWVPQAWYGQGHYYRLRGRSPFDLLIYPLPPSHSLGVHLGLDLAGQARFGPDLRWIDAPDYRFDDSRRREFVAAIADWWPGVPAERLEADYVGVRPKISGPGDPPADFQLQDATHHGLEGLVNLFGIESPGLTSALAIGEAVAAVLRGRD